MSNEELIDAIDECISHVRNILNRKDFIEYDEPDEFKKELKKLTAPVSSRKRSILFRLFGDSELNDKILELETVIEKLSDSIEKHNDHIASKRIAGFRKSISEVESHEFDDQQIRSIVYDVRNRLVVAGAGSGKTTTIVGLVKYLLLTDVKPDEILLLSFTNASVDELRNRIINETGEEIKTVTFHKLGMGIITEATGKCPNVAHLDINTFVSDTVRTLCGDPKYADMLNSYVRFGISDPNDDIEYVDERKIYTMKWEVVKSHGEKDIADYLYLHNVPYVYEESYGHDVADDRHTQYHPDFHLTGTDIYIEYFGISRDGKVAPYFSSRSGDASSDYRKSMEWKKGCHKKYRTRLISLYAYQRSEGALTDELQSALDGMGVKTEFVLSSLFLEKMEIDNTLMRISNEFITSIMLLKCRDMTLKEFSKTIGFLDIGMKRYVKLIGPVYDAYVGYLKEKREIDFEDMLNRASNLVDKGKYRHPYRYVIVDEYQDISTSRYRLLKSLRDSKDYRLFCVGDDWQSIYRFNGTDIAYFIDFEKYWGRSKILTIDRTYRFSGKLLDTSGRFIQKNPMQFRKSLKGPKGTDSFVKVINTRKENDEGICIENRLADLPENSTVFVLGRYGFDLNLINNCKTAQRPDGSVSLKFESRDDLDIRFMTVHNSKGLQADYVFIINCRNGKLGFPNRLGDSPFLQRLMESDDDFPFSEERRLFYVAMTRAKKGVFLVLRRGQISEFVDELFSKNH